DAGESLLKFEHKLIHRPVRRRLDGEITGIFRVAPEIALRNEPETCRFDFMTQHTLLNAMQTFAYRSAVAGSRRMVRNPEQPAGLERRVKPAVHRGTIDRHVGRIVVKKEKCDEVEIVHLGGQRVIKRAPQRDDVAAGRRVQPGLESCLGALAELRPILSIDDTARSNRTREELGAVATTGTHIQDLHSRARRCENKKLQRIAAFIDLTIRLGAIRRSYDCRIIRNAVRRQGGSACESARRERYWNGKGQAGMDTRDMAAKDAHSLTRRMPPPLSNRFTLQGKSWGRENRKPGWRASAAGLSCRLRCRLANHFP